MNKTGSVGKKRTLCNTRSAEDIQPAKAEYMTEMSDIIHDRSLNMNHATPERSKKMESSDVLDLLPGDTRFDGFLIGSVRSSVERQPREYDRSHDESILLIVDSQLVTERSNVKDDEEAAIFP